MVIDNSFLMVPFFNSRSDHSSNKTTTNKQIKVKYLNNFLKFEKATLPEIRKHVNTEKNVYIQM